MSKVKIQSVQAIRFLEFNMEEGTGGVMVFRGPNGAGKTTALGCLSALLGQKVNLQPTEGAPKGTIEGFGVTKTVASKTSTKGEANAISLEGRFDFSDLVAPPIKDPIARNKSRIRALVGLTAKSCNANDFAQLFDSPEQFKSAVPESAVRGVTDPIELADIVKKMAEAKARDLELKVEDHTSRWQVAVEQSKGAKADAPPVGVAALAAAYSEAKQKLSVAEAAIQANARAVEHNTKVCAMLEKHIATKPSKSAEEIGEKLKQFKKTVADLEAQLLVARKTVEQLQGSFDAAIDWADRLAELDDSMLVLSDDIPSVDLLEIEERRSLKALEGAEEIKQRYESAVKAAQYAASIQANGEAAKKLRAISASTGKVITKMLPQSCPLQVNESGMLGVQHEGRGHWVEIDQLSEGERWEVGMSVAIESVGEGGIIPLRQEAWQSLDQESKALVAKQCQAAKVWVLTGEVAEGDLRAEEFQLESAAS